MNFRFFVFIIALCGAGFLSVARADIAPNPLSGGISLQTTGREPTEIALRHNTVKIKVTPQLCTTRAFFRLHNTGAPVRLEVGFPLMYKGESKDFQLFIDDKAATFRDKIEHGFTPIKQPYVRHWKAWNMKFEAGQTQLVEVRYSNPPSEGYSDNLAQWGRTPFYQNWIATLFDYDVADFGYSKSEKLSDWTKVKMMEYVLVSGSYWKGPIERCRVEADIEEIPTDGIIDVFPAAQLMSPRQIVWQWRDVEPQSNIRFVFMGVSPRRQIMPMLEKILRANPDDEPVRKTLDLMTRDFAEGGVIDKLQESLREK